MKIKDLFSFNMLCDIYKHNFNLTCSLEDICIAIRGTFGSQSMFCTPALLFNILWFIASQYEYFV